MTDAVVRCSESIAASFFEIRNSKILPPPASAVNNNVLFRELSPLASQVEESLNVEFLSRLFGPGTKKKKGMLG
jgi:hypothetical protein